MRRDWLTDVRRPGELGPLLLDPDETCLALLVMDSKMKLPVLPFPCVFVRAGLGGEGRRNALEK